MNRIGLLLATSVLGCSRITTLSAASEGNTTYYVSTGGSDTQEGVIASPFATLRHALEKAQPGDSILLGEGIYHERVEITKSGSEGKPITIEGSRGPKGERLSIIDGGIPVAPDTWQPAPEVGPGVYKTSSIPFMTNLLAVDGSFVAPVNAKAGEKKDLTAMQVLAWPQDYRSISKYFPKGAPAWKTLGGIYYVESATKTNSTTWLRLANGRSPAEHRVAASPGDAVVKLADASYIILRGLSLRTGETGLLLQGKGTRFNQIEDCAVSCAKTRIHITEGASRNRVAESSLTMGFIGAESGPWGGDENRVGEDEERASIRFFLYNFFKYYASPTQISDDRAININAGACDNLIENNQIHGGLVGIQANNTKGLVIRGNRISNFSSVGMALRERSEDIRVEDNLVEDCNINIRLHNLNADGGHRITIQRNRSLLPNGMGSHIFTHSVQTEKPYSDPVVSIVNNTFIGGKNGITLPFPAFMPKGVPGFSVMNNVFDHCGRPVVSKIDMTTNKAMMGTFDYNYLIGGSIPNGIPVWFGAHNVVNLTSDEAVKSPAPDRAETANTLTTTK